MLTVFKCFVFIVIFCCIVSFSVCVLVTDSYLKCVSVIWSSKDKILIQTVSVTSISPLRTQKCVSVIVVSCEIDTQERSRQRRKEGGLEREEEEWHPLRQGRGEKRAGPASFSKYVVEVNEGEQNMLPEALAQHVSVRNNGSFQECRVQ